MCTPKGADHSPVGRLDPPKGITVLGAYLMAGESRPSIVQRVGSEPVRAAALRIGAIISIAALVAFAMYAVASAGDASAHGSAAAADAPARRDPSVLRGFALVPDFSASDGRTIGDIARFAEAAGQPSATPSPTATATALPPTATIPAPTPAVPPVTPAARPQAPAPPPLPTSTPAPAAASAPWGLDTSPMDAYSRALFEATNGRRIASGLPPLRVNGYLIGIGRIRSQDMAAHNYFAHVSPVTGDNAFTLMDAHGVPYGWAGENLAKNNYPDADTVSVADNALWNSPPHRENILNANYTDMGIALAVDGSGMKYFTIIFAGPP